LANQYALDESYPAKLQPELFGRYIALPTLWHCWLKLEKLGDRQKQISELVQQQLATQPEPELELEPEPEPELEPVVQAVVRPKRHMPPEVIRVPCTQLEARPEPSQPETRTEPSTPFLVTLEPSTQPNVTPEPRTPQKAIWEDCPLPEDGQVEDCELPPPRGVLWKLQLAEG
jgi:hypothetical protein